MLQLNNGCDLSFIWYKSNYMKTYFTKYAYRGNTEVFWIDQDKIEGSSICVDYELGGFIQALICFDYHEEKDKLKIKRYLEEYNGTSI